MQNFHMPTLNIKFRKFRRNFRDLIIEYEKRTVPNEPLDKQQSSNGDCPSISLHVHKIKRHHITGTT